MGMPGKARQRSAVSAMLIEFLGNAKLSTPGAGCRSWPVAPVSQGSFRPENANCHAGHREVAWDPAVALARGSDRCAPTLPASAHEEWRECSSSRGRPRSMKKNCETNPITAQESWWFSRLNGKGTQPIRRPAGPTVRPSPRRCPSAVPSLLRRRRHGFPRSDGRPERRARPQ
jgi:hypothetical protein